MNDILTIERILDYCDVPQLFTARDTFDTLYLCLLYDDSSAYQYTGIRISTKRLDSFLSGMIDLRALFCNPENTGEYYDVVFRDNQYYKSLSSMNILSEDKLPSEGYYVSEDERENVVVNIPMKDRGLLKELVYKLGWVCM